MATKNKKPTGKNKGGRPTNYRIEYCDKVIAHMSKGFSFESFAGEVGVCKDTLYEWVKNHKEFSDSKNIGFELNRRFWEKVGIDIATGTGVASNGNATAFIFNMKNRFKNEWRDKVETGITDKDGEDVAIGPDLSKLSDKELRQLAELQRKCRVGQAPSD